MKVEPRLMAEVKKLVGLGAYLSVGDALICAATTGQIIKGRLVPTVRDLQATAKVRIDHKKQTGDSEVEL